MYVHVSTSAPTLEALLARLDGSASPIAMLAVGGGDPSLSDMHAEDGRARPVSIREYGSLDLSTHIFAITSPPGGVHIFAWLARCQLSQLCAQTLHIFAYYPRTYKKESAKWL